MAMVVGANYIQLDHKGFSLSYGGIIVPKAK